MKNRGLIISGITLLIGVFFFVRDILNNSQKSKDLNKNLEKARQAKADKALQKSMEEEEILTPLN